MLNLPTPVLSIIASMLPYKDLVNFRLTCMTFYDASLSKKTLQWLKVRPKILNKWFLKFSGKIYGGRFVEMSLLALKKNQLEMILTKLPNIEKLELDIRNLHCIKDLCSNLRNLSLVDKDLEFVEKMDPNTYKPYFERTLLNLKLKKLSLSGCNPIYYSDMLMVILDSTKSIDTLEMTRIFIKHRIPDDLELFKCKLLSCTSIKHWIFKELRVENAWGLRLPETALSYRSLRTDLLLIDKKHVQLEWISFHGISPAVDNFLTTCNFVNLKCLDLHGCYYYCSSLKQCQNLKVLKLMNCRKLQAFFKKLSTNVKDKLLVLHIEAHQYMNNEKMIDIVNSFSELRELVLTRVVGITPSFLWELKNEKLTFTSVKNCKDFNDRKSQEELKMMKQSLPFTVNNDPNFIEKPS